MNRYDLAVSDARNNVTKHLIATQNNENADLLDVSGAIDGLNTAWSRLADSLQRRIEELESQVLRLIEELAEAKHHGPQA